ncbi:hypothetical protein, partial [Klebsiella pneumoniae]|uniref:hypothetical protein n=1 Tax=Klebsiella pneumoniae TaxID=573 RepID=UPI001A9CB06C
GDLVDCWSFNGRGLSPLDLYRSPGAHCFYNQYSNIVFFQIQAERELIKWLLLPVRGTSFTVFENSQCF